MSSLVDKPEILVPHRGNALFLSRVLRHEADTIDCIGVIPGSSAFVREGRAPSYLGLELAAQAAAALEMLSSKQTSPHPRPGYLVGVREARFAMEWIPAECEIHARVRRTGQAGPLTVHDVWLEVAGSECVTGVISTYAR